MTSTERINEIIEKIRTLEADEAIEFVKGFIQ